MKKFDIVMEKAKGINTDPFTDDDYDFILEIAEKFSYENITISEGVKGRIILFDDKGKRYHMSVEDLLQQFEDEIFIAVADVEEQRQINVFCDKLIALRGEEYFRGFKEEIESRGKDFNSVIIKLLGGGIKK